MVKQLKQRALICKLLMNKYIKITILLVFPLLIVLAGVFFSLRKTSKKVAGIQTSPEERSVRGLILPHHKLAEEFITKSFEKIKDENYSHVVIFGPNHYTPEVSPLVTADTIFNYEIRNNLLDSLLQEYPDILVSNELVENEHSITLHLPYIKNFFPEAEIIPFMISSVASKNDLYRKINYLVSLMPADTLYIASVDFSHNEMIDAAMKNNEESINAIKNFDFHTIYGFEDDHMDSPVSIVILLKSIQQLNSTTWEIWYSTHASSIKNDPTLQGTSYVIGAFR